MVWGHQGPLMGFQKAKKKNQISKMSIKMGKSGYVLFQLLKSKTPHQY